MKPYFSVYSFFVEGAAFCGAGSQMGRKSEWLQCVRKEKYLYCRVCGASELVGTAIHCGVSSDRTEKAG
jgi:hypothetical protein